ncbi:hypothetical protein D5H75_15405 [Bailinhaonella thermotolerans]|uniref:Uncharacterized protein n=2 Tax=Bailinhaonella thermotolerans TaxID=1070861 RepID=A0A3A4AX13_9ACTN|nr:hypothetical protein D5H75_15405 [Bailinhaonella thermotolerans]
MHGYAYADNSPVTSSDPRRPPPRRLPLHVLLRRPQHQMGPPQHEAPQGHDHQRPGGDNDRYTRRYPATGKQKPSCFLCGIGNWVNNTARNVSNWVSEHKTVIVSTVVGVAVTAGCLALTAGVGSIGCAALGGAASSATSYMMDTPAEQQNILDAAVATFTGAALGALGGAVAGKVRGFLAGKLSGRAASTVAKASPALRPPPELPRRNWSPARGARIMDSYMNR